ncbi:hypothetical protein [Dictyobacter alpinus]|uniref:hypothetical protein n=1 Tax=Dictyobacter alpinus TaxID=2014873 RepID=UPI000F81A4CA|nr:hypothetical protein [Dictyobacter alpinus]
MHSAHTTMERHAFIHEMETIIHDSETIMQQTVHHDAPRFQRPCEAWRQANEAWLQVAQAMSPEKAHAVLVGMAVGGTIHTWMTQRTPGPPPSVLSLYPHGPLSDDAFGKKIRYRMDFLTPPLTMHSHHHSSSHQTRACRIKGGEMLDRCWELVGEMAPNSRILGQRNVGQDRSEPPPAHQPDSFSPVFPSSINQKRVSSSFQSHRLERRENSSRHTIGT